MNDNNQRDKKLISEKNISDKELSEKENPTNIFKKPSKDSPPFLMVNLQIESESEIDHIRTLIKLNTSIFRINCAFGNHESWKKITDNISNASAGINIKPKLLFDITGNKIRIGSIISQNIIVDTFTVFKNETIIIHSGNPSFVNNSSVEIICQGLSDFSFCKKKDIVRFDDSIATGEIIEIYKDGIIIKMHDNHNSIRLQNGKGINFPDSIVYKESLSQKDVDDISFMMNHGDILCLSFIQTKDDVQLIYNHLMERYSKLPPVVIKIETCKAVENLHEILTAGQSFPEIAILVARGDLVSECGWKEMARIQDYIYTEADTTGLPVILATGILEEFNKTGLPTRAEITDFQYSQKYDCILINKGQYMYDVIKFCNSYNE